MTDQADRRRPGQVTIEQPSITVEDLVAKTIDAYQLQESVGQEEARQTVTNVLRLFGECGGVWDNVSGDLAFYLDDGAG